MGGYLVYYGLVLAVFAPLGLVPLVRLAEKDPPRPSVPRCPGPCWPRALPPAMP